MPFTIPNVADAAFPDQAQLDKVDLDVLAAADAGYGVTTGAQRILTLTTTGRWLLRANHRDHVADHNRVGEDAVPGGDVLQRAGPLVGDPVHRDNVTLSSGAGYVNQEGPHMNYAKFFAAAASVVAVVAGAVSSTAANPVRANSLATTPTTYYVDSAAGSDARSGLSKSQAWRTLGKASAASLAAGDRVLLRRNSRFTDRLTVTASGTAASRITVDAYGQGMTPVITTTGPCVVLRGSYVTAQNLNVDRCASRSGAISGFRIEGDHVTVQRSWITHNSAGVEVAAESALARILNNTVIDNNVMVVNTPGGNDDHGAFGILLHGTHTEVAYNRISGSDAFSYDYGRDGAAVEIYGAKGSNVHRNLAVDNNAFAELGHPDSSDNTYAYNIVISRLASSHGLVTRGPNDFFGPVKATKFYHNTIYLTGDRSIGFVCYAGCDDTILDFRNNVVQAVEKTGSSDGPVQDHNVYFGGPNHFIAGPHDITADSRFRDAAANNLRLLPGSPAIDQGADLGYRADFDANRVPADADGDGAAAPDIGAYEYQPSMAFVT